MSAATWSTSTASTGSNERLSARAASASPIDSPPHPENRSTTRSDDRDAPHGGATVLCSQARSASSADVGRASPPVYPAITLAALRPSRRVRTRS